MGPFEEMLINAQSMSKSDFEKLLCIYNDMLSKYASINGVLDEDLRQELTITFIDVVRKFDP